MAFPSETFVGQFSSELQPVADELRASGSQLTSYLGTEHKADGSHGALTADSIDVSGDATLSGYVVIDGADIDTTSSDYQVQITRDGNPLHVTLIGPPCLRIYTAVAGTGSPFIQLDQVDAPTISSPSIALGAGIYGVGYGLNTAGDASIGVGAGRDLVISTRIRERGRTIAMGEWIAVAYAAGNFTASAGTWTVDVGDQATYAYTLIGKTMTLAWIINATDVSAGASLRIAIPGGFTAARGMHGSYRAVDAGGTAVSALCLVTAAGTYVELYADQAANNFTITAGDNTFVSGVFSFEIS